MLIHLILGGGSAACVAIAGVGLELFGLGQTEFGILAAIFAVLLILFTQFAKPAPRQSGVRSTGASNATEKKAAKKDLLPMNIFFGSQSGTAETFSEELAEEAARYGFAAEVIDLEDMDNQEIVESPLAVYLMATFGEGDPTDNALDFVEWVHTDDAEDEVDVSQDSAFAVFALGNRQYEHFCNVGRELDKRLSDLGVSRLCPHGEGDDDGTLDEDYSEWKETFWNAIKEKYGVTDSGPLAYTPKFCSYIYPHPDDNTGIETVPGIDIIKDGFQRINKRYKPGLGSFKGDTKCANYVANVSDNVELRQDTKDGNTYRVEIDLSDIALRYVTADNMGIYPRNDQKLVAEMCQVLNMYPETMFSTQPKSTKKLPFPMYTSVQDALSWYCDFLAIPRPHQLHVLAQYAQDEEEATLLKYWGEDEKGHAEFKQDEKSLKEVLEACPSVKLPWAVFLEIVPKLVPRFFTISSSNTVQPTSVSLTVVHEWHQKPRGRIYNGICSTFLKDQELKQVACFVRPSTFRLPKDLSNPVIMIGPGTGFAPFRAYLQKGKYLQDKGENLGDWILYFGCAHKERDWIYRDLMEDSLESGLLSDLRLAFSRDQKEKVYVQHLLKEDGQKVWDLIANQNAHVYICGASRMGRDIRQVLEELASDHGSMNAATAKGYVEQMTKDKRYVAELW